MSINGTLEAFGQKLREVATLAGSVLLAGIPTNRTDPLLVVLDGEEMLRVITAVKPQLVYILEHPFDSDLELEEALDEFQDHEGQQSPQDFEDLRKEGVRFNGKVCAVNVAFFTSGVLHLCHEQTDWYSALTGRYEERIATIRAGTDGAELERNRQRDAKLSEKAAQLAAHEAFNFNRAGLEKRRYLAGQLFPDCGDQELYRIVEEATNIDWFNSSGSA